MNNRSLIDRENLNQLLVRLFIVGSLVCGALLLTGCSAADNTLDGTKWKLTGWSISSQDPADFTITANFADGQISGTSAVNTYGGSYKTGPGDAFSVGQLSSTLMGASEPAMRAESTFTTLLTEAKSYKISDAKLILYDKNGNESLIFSAEHSP